MIRHSLPFLAVVGCLLPWAARADQELPLDTNRFELVKRESGPVNYYTKMSEDGSSFIRSAYKWPMKTAVMGIQFPDELHHGAHKLRWRWRALALPVGGDECSPKADSAAVMYVMWKNGLRWYTLKYVWSAVGKKGVTCDGRRNPFVAQDTVILESGGPLNTWANEEIDLSAEFRKHFRDGDPNGEVPAFMGLGLMSDGDQTESDSSADFGDFVITH